MNTKYIIYDAEGTILRTGGCPVREVRYQAAENEFVIEGTASCLHDAMDPVSKKVIPGGRKRFDEVTSGTSRKSPGISTATQLDLLWQAMDAGTFPKAEPFYSAIKAQKDAK